MARGESRGERIPASLHPASRLQFGRRPHSVRLVFLGSGSSGRRSVALIPETLLDSALHEHQGPLVWAHCHSTCPLKKGPIEVERVVLKGPLGALENNISVRPSPSLRSDSASGPCGHRVLSVAPGLGMCLESRTAASRGRCWRRTRSRGHSRQSLSCEMVAPKAGPASRRLSSTPLCFPPAAGALGAGAVRL